MFSPAGHETATGVHTPVPSVHESMRTDVVSCGNVPQGDSACPRAANITREVSAVSATFIFGPRPSSDAATHDVDSDFMLARPGLQKRSDWNTGVMMSTTFTGRIFGDMIEGAYES